MKIAVAYACDISKPVEVLKRAQDEFMLLSSAAASEPEMMAQVQGLITHSHAGVPDWAWNAPQMKIISCNGVGYDGIDIEKAQSNGIWVSNTPDVLNEEVADMAMAMILGSARHVLAADIFVRSGAWASGKDFPLVAGVEGKRLGMLGMGKIGQAIARRASACNMQISYSCRTSKDVPYAYEADLVKLARASQVLCAVVPGGEGTRKLVSEEVLEALGPEGYLVNVARGSVVDEPALVNALASKKIAGAALDVYAKEPHVPRELFELDNVILLPHIASASISARIAMGFLAIDNICDVLAGKRPRCAVNQVS